MSASMDTAQRVIEVVGHYVSDRTLRKIVEELKSVPGNQSFRATIERLSSELEKRERKSR